MNRVQKNGDIEYDKLYAELFEGKMLAQKNEEVHEEEKLLQEKLTMLEEGEHQKLLAEYMGLADKISDLKLRTMEARKKLSDVLVKGRNVESNVKQYIRKVSLEVEQLEIEERLS